MATATPETEEKWTQEEIDETAKAIAKGLGMEEETTPPPAKPPEEEQPDEDAAKSKADEDAKAKTEEPKKKEEVAAATPPPPAAPAAAAPTADEIATKVAERMTPAKGPPAKTEPDLSPEDKRNRDVFEFMAKEDPKQFGGITEKFDKFIAAERGYRKTWEKANPGKKFDPEGEEHAAFYEENDPIQTEELQEAFDQSKIELIATRKAEEKMAERETKLAREDAIKTVTARLKALPGEVMTDLAKAVDPELAKDISKIGENDPAAEIVLGRYAPTLEAMKGELVKAFSKLNYPIDDQNNPLHKAIVQATWAFENELLSKPDQQTLPDGRKLVAFEDWSKMPPDQQQRHWTIWAAPDKVGELLTRDFAAKAKADLDRIRAKSGKTEKASAPSTAPKPPEKKAEEPKKDEGSDSFPNTTKGAESGGAADKNGAVDPDFQKKVMAELFGS